MCITESVTTARMAVLHADSVQATAMRADSVRSDLPFLAGSDRAGQRNRDPTPPQQRHLHGSPLHERVGEHALLSICASFLGGSCKKLQQVSSRGPVGEAGNGDGMPAGADWIGSGRRVAEARPGGLR
ncbi:hypothetical protein GCM10023107_12480 [Actinoplanes octamycinicus]|nr:hypothetical protein Aoc01nite_16420 [Actinoplanes octamycinicus]